MKRVYLSLVLFTGFGLLGASAQTWGGYLHFNDEDSPASTSVVCSDYDIRLEGIADFTNLPADGDSGHIAIDWGDGIATDYSITYSGIPGQLSFWPYLYHHTYAPGTYVVTAVYWDEIGNTDTVTRNITATPLCGTVYAPVMLDENGDGIGDLPVPNAQLDFTDSATQTKTTHYMGDLNDQYVHSVDVTKVPYTVTPNFAWLVANNYNINVQPPSGTVAMDTSVLDALPPFVVVRCDPNVPVSQVNLGVDYLYGFGFRAGMSTGFVKISVCNRSCDGTVNTDFDFTFDPLLTVYDHDIPGATVTGNTLNANFDLVSCQHFTVYFTVPGTTPAGTPLNFSANVTAVDATDYDLSNNSATLAGEVRNSWDPNDKSVNRPQVISPTQSDEFTYVIRFQNMGNDDAFNIVVKDTLDSDLDLSSFNLLELSHTGSVNVDPVTRIATFNFPNIHLPPASQDEPGSHGYAIYKIKENANLPVGSEITNTAYIYFDFNPPIITNTTFNVNRVSGVSESETAVFETYPVPASDYLTVVSKNGTALGNLKLVDVTGKTVLTVNVPQNSYSLDVKSLANGVYSLQVQRAAGAYRQKVIVRK